jgi:hypothetical protein
LKRGSNWNPVVVVKRVSGAAPALDRSFGTDLMAQILVIPAVGVDAPWLQMPPGRRFVLR